MENQESSSSLFFFKGNEDTSESVKPKEGQPLRQAKLQKVKDAFLKVLDTKNLSFLLGSGCSSYIVDDDQIGVPVMKNITEDFYKNEALAEEKKFLKDTLKIDVTSTEFSSNLEVFLSVLHSLSFYYSKVGKELEMPETFEEMSKHQKVNFLIKKARDYLLKACLNEANSKPNGEETKDMPLLELYKKFYRKLLSRNPTLPRLNIFTTNYDLYSERAMDSLGINFMNGFTGGLSKFFNPSIFNHILAEKMDLSQSKLSAVDNLFYLYKLHGSVNWIEEELESKLFKVKELQTIDYKALRDEETIMIHPTPLKYNASLGSPYSDLFREFQKKLMQTNNILVTVGYSFSDEHLNNLIFQAFTIPSFRLVVLGKPETSNKIQELMKLNDSRIWVIGENDSSNPIHYFEGFVQEILPDLSNEDLDNKMDETIRNLKHLLR